jgi:hypothetical protein
VKFCCIASRAVELPCDAALLQHPSIAAIARIVFQRRAGGRAMSRLYLTTLTLAAAAALLQALGAMPQYAGELRRSESTQLTHRPQ